MCCEGAFPIAGKSKRCGRCDKLGYDARNRNSPHFIMVSEICLNGSQSFAFSDAFA